MTRWDPPYPRFRLVDGPSPLQPLPRLSRVLGELARTAGAPTDALDPAVWMKREDLLPLAFGGNKLRNLEFHVGAALAAGADTLVTSGRRWSNHARLTAAAAARAGLACHLVLSGPQPGRPGPNVRLAELLGAVVHLATTADRAERAALVERLAADLRTAGRRPHVIPVGGSSLEGAAGQVLAGLELADQLGARGVRPDLVAVPSATGGTQAGILVGLRLAGLEARVVGFAVTPPDDLRAAVVRLASGLADESGLSAASAAAGRPFDPEAEVVVDGRTLGGGYGIRSEAAEEASRLLARCEAILVDPIYTAKGLAGLVALARHGALGGRTAVFWHAGGTPGLFEELDG